jgi:signal transduction histidine kinase
MCAFTRKRSKISELGLGLSLSKMLVELHGGRIWLEDKDEPGSTFKIFSAHDKKEMNSDEDIDN